jgi:hypothetical protein
VIANPELSGVGDLTIRHPEAGGPVVTEGPLEHPGEQQYGGPGHQEEIGRRRTAFVLGGGGSVGAVQVGMLRALLEAGIRPDLVVGTSIGALNGAFLVGHLDLDGMKEMKRFWISVQRREVFPISHRNLVRGVLGSSQLPLHPPGLAIAHHKCGPWILAARRGAGRHPCGGDRPS